jgi:hypothetical protein
MLYTHAVAGSPEAARFLSPENSAEAPRIAAYIMQKKLQTYLKFNETYPGFGGFLPWVSADTQDMTPRPDWVNRVPGLDNGYVDFLIHVLGSGLTISVCLVNLCGLYTVSFRPLRTRAIRTIKNSPKNGRPGWTTLRLPPPRYISHDLPLNFDQSANPLSVDQIFYKGNGRVCTVIDIKDQSLPVNHPDQSYLCETTDLLDDPFEGEIFTFWLQFFGGLSKADKQALWEVKKSQLVSVDYKMGEFGPITVQKGL